MATALPTRKFLGMRLGLVGCGYVADFYAQTLRYHPELTLIGVYDQQVERTARFADHYRTARYESLEALLADDQIDLVVNLTNPRSHYAVTKAALEAGKHVYSEKPLATCFTAAQELVALAKQRQLYLSAAPCTLLGEAAQTVWQRLRAQAIGRVYLAYAELDDGLIHRVNYQKWITDSGAPWPYADEFETGCTVEHAGYYVSWLTAFFGPAQRVTSFAACVAPDKQLDPAVGALAPDFSVGCIEFASGVVVRITCSIVADHDHSLTIVGEDGSLIVAEAWDHRSPIYQQRTPLHRRREKLPVLSKWLGYGKQRLAHATDPNPHYRPKPPGMPDVCRGIAELASAIREQRPSRLSAEHALHITEIVLTLQNPQEMGSPRQLQSTFAPIDPLPWALNA